MTGQRGFFLGGGGVCVCVFVCVFGWVSCKCKMCAVCVGHVCGVCMCRTCVRVCLKIRLLCEEVKPKSTRVNQIPKPTGT